jgi:hypothetical protein
VRWTRHAARTEDEKPAYSFLSEDLKTRDYIQDLGIDRKMMINKMDLRKKYAASRMHLGFMTLFSSCLIRGAIPLEEFRLKLKLVKM